MVAGIFDGEVERNFKPIPEGIYYGYVSKIEARTSKNGNPYVNLEFTLQEFNGRKQWDRLMWHNDACVNVMKGKLESLGFTRDERKQLDPDNIEQLISAVNYMVSGKVYEIKVGFDKEGQNVIKYYNDPNAPEETEADPLAPETEPETSLPSQRKSRKLDPNNPW